MHHIESITTNNNSKRRENKIELTNNKINSNKEKTERKSESRESEMKKNIFSSKNRNFGHVTSYYPLVCISCIFPVIVFPLFRSSSIRSQFWVNICSASKSYSYWPRKKERHRKIGSHDICVCPTACVQRTQWVPFPWIKNELIFSKRFFFLVPRVWKTFNRNTYMYWFQLDS